MSLFSCVRSISLAAVVAALGLKAWGAGTPAPVPLEQAKGDVLTLALQLKDAKKGNEDLIASIGALQAEFFHLAPLAGVAPKDPGADGAEDARKAFQVAQKQWDDDQKGWQSLAKVWQGAALDVLFRALRVVEYRSKDNARNDVNLRAAQALGELLGSAELAALRDAREVDRLRSERAKELEDVIANDFGRPKGNRDYTVPGPVLEATFAALARTQRPAALQWLADEYIHARSGAFEEARLVAAHKALTLFVDVPGKTRFELVQRLVTLYAAVEASTQQKAGATPQARAAATAAKAFWDKLKDGVVAAVNHFATPPGGTPPTGADGQGLTTLRGFATWWRDHDHPNRAPWLDPAEPAPKAVR